MKRLNKDKIIKVLMMMSALVFFIFLYIFNNVDKVKLIDTEGTDYEKALVLEVLEDNLQEDGKRSGYQKVKVKVLSGEYKNEEVEATSMSGNLYGATCKVGMKVVVKISTSGEKKNIDVYSYNRAPIIYIFVLLYLLMLWLIGGKKGFKSAVSLIFTFICVMFLFLPMLYKGYSPFLSAVIIVTLITIVSLYLIDGFTRKSISAIIGTIIGVIISGIVAGVFSYFAKITGLNVSAIEELIFVANNTALQAGGILFAGILIASLGAVMDVSMSVASTINEIHERNKNLSRKELFKSGINVGRDMMGTMSNTLILAFTGGSINTLILNYAYALKYNQIINMYDIGIEIMQGLSGSFAVILTVPLVSFIASFLCAEMN